MKIIKSGLIGLFAAITIQFAAQAQSNPQFCQIHSGNVGQYTSQYDIFNHTAQTPYRPFVQNSRVYKVTNDLIAMPLFYARIPSNNASIPDNSVGAAFELKGKYGNHVISNKEVAVQHIIFYPYTSTFQILGICINGTFIRNNDQKAYSTRNLPVDTFQALQEAWTGIQQEIVGNMFK